MLFCPCAVAGNYGTPMRVNYVLEANAHFCDDSMADMVSFRTSSLLNGSCLS